ncbi:radical SAM protein [Nonomuraea deserti]|uniref:Radical SAM protein n=1 Tax=Nonomuraea deserti TaxID=1848322 RepID=A0A4R4VFC2_9ACTN|nr:radical SAM protein [Nonomuraea deserti]TDD04279.1 radical SAM protein [Nonomuraea deserti]
MRVLLLYANPHLAIPVSPYGLDAVNTALQARCGPVEVLTSNPFLESVEPEAHLGAVLAYFDPDVIAISIRNIDNAIVALPGEPPPGGSPIDIVAYAPAIRELTDVIKRWRADALCVAGGSGFTACPAEFLRYLDLDYGLIGPAESAFAQFVEALRAPYSKTAEQIFPELPGAIFRDKGEFRRTPSRPTLGTEISAPPRLAPEYQLLYRLRHIPVAVRTKAGCPLRCAYCTDPVNQLLTDRRSVENVVADLRHHVEDHGLRRFHIADAELNLPYEDHLRRVCAGIRDSGLAEQISWRGYFNITPFSDELIDALVAAGCDAPSFAVDSFHDMGLRAHQKNFRSRHAHDVLNRLLSRAPGIVPEVCLLFGSPGETMSGIEANIHWMLRYAERGVRIAYSCGLRVYPNTPLGRQTLDTTHVYLPSGPLGGRGGRRFAPDELLRETVVYCEPLSPRELSHYLEQRVGGHPNIATFTDGQWPEARHSAELRLFNVGVHRMAYGKFDAARDHLYAALQKNPELSVAHTAIGILDGLNSN